MISPVTPMQVAGWRAMALPLSPKQRVVVMTTATTNQPQGAAAKEEER